MISSSSVGLISEWRRDYEVDCNRLQRDEDFVRKVPMGRSQCKYSGQRKQGRYPAVPKSVEQVRSTEFMRDGIEQSEIRTLILPS